MALSNRPIADNPGHDAVTRDAMLLRLPVRRVLTLAALQRAVCLLIVCRSRAETELAALTAYQGRTLADAADALGVSTGRAREMLAGLEARDRAAASRIENDRRLAEIAAGTTKGTDHA